MRARGSDAYESIVELIPADFSNPDDSLVEIRAKFDFVHGQPVGEGVTVDYSLAPQAQFPTQLDELVAAHDSLLAADNEDPFVNPDWMRLRAHDYLGPDVDPAHPLVSAVNADLSGLPPMLLQTGEVDLCLPGARTLAERADAPVVVDVVPAVAQGFQGMGTHIPEVAGAWATVRGWIDRVVAPGQARGA